MPLKIDLPSPLYNVEFQSLKYGAGRRIYDEWQTLDPYGAYGYIVGVSGSCSNLSDVISMAKRLQECLRRWDWEKTTRLIEVAVWQRNRPDLKDVTDAKLKAAVEAALAWALDWLPTALAFKAASKNVIKGRKPSANPRQTPARTIEGTGTCAVCSRNVKIPDGKIYDHGFHLRGYREGKCHGVGFRPFELSPEGAKSYRDFLVLRLAATVQALDGFKAMDPKKVVGVVKGRDILAERRVHDLTTEVRYIESDIKHYKERVKNWKLSPLPDAKLEHVCRK